MSYEYFRKATDYVGIKEGEESLNILLLHYNGKFFNPVKTEWCAAFIGAILSVCGSKGTGSLMARSYLKWGKKVELDDAQQGDIVVLKRGWFPWQGHVGFFSSYTYGSVVLLGGNQSDKVCFKGFPKNKILGIRREV